jgi:cation diffusion facilitator family transporter
MQLGIRSGQCTCEVTHFELEVPPCRLTDGSSRWLWVDPVCTFAFAFSVVWVTKSLVVDVLNNLMEAAPPDIDLRALLRELESASDVAGVHDMHVWTIGSGKHILTAHVNAEDDAHPYELVQRLEKIISTHGIHHSTVQICSGRVTVG